MPPTLTPETQKAADALFLTSRAGGWERPNTLHLKTQETDAREWLENGSLVTAGAG
jgi:hypothetical protein